MRRDITKLLLKTQDDIIRLWVEKGLIREDAPLSFSKAKLTRAALDLIDDQLYPPKEFLASFRALYPRGAKSNNTEITEKINIFLRNHPDIEVNWDKFLKAAELYVQDKGAFAGYAKYFFHKSYGAEEEYRILEYLDAVEETPVKRYGTTIL